MKPNFLNKELNQQWYKHQNYFELDHLNNGTNEVKKEEAVIGGSDKTLYILSISLTPYFYSTIEQRDFDYEQVLKLI